MVRELTILSRDFGRAARGCDEMARALRKHLRPPSECDKTTINKGRSGTEISRVSGEALSLPFPEFGSGSEEDYD